MSIYISKGITYLTSELLEFYNVKHGFFMRHGGTSPFPWKSLNMATSVGDSSENVIENRKRIADSLKIGKFEFYDLWQVHSNEVVIAGKPRQRGEPHLKADAIVTDKVELALLMQFADCVPILLYDPERKVIASAHAGWKGTLSGIAAETVKVMVEKYKSEPGKIIAVIGPSICREHYQIGDDVASKVNSVFKPEEKVLTYTKEKIFMDLSAANKILLEKMGIKNIEIMDICTFCNKDDWFSHRGENGKTGRFASVIAL